MKPLHLNVQVCVVYNMNRDDLNSVYRLSSVVGHSLDVTNHIINRLLDADIALSNVFYNHSPFFIPINKCTTRSLVFCDIYKIKVSLEWNELFLLPCRALLHDYSQLSVALH